MFMWMDKSGSDARNHIWKFEYALRGITPTTSSVCGETFLDFVRGTLIPEMEPFDGTSKKSIAIMDYRSIHHIAEV